MKNKICIICLILVTGFLTSCVFSTWIPEEDYSKLTQKKSVKTFEQLNDPMLFFQRVKVPFHYKFDKTNCITPCIGSVFYIYDWETNQIYDYVYTNNEIFTGHYILNQLCPDENGKTDYFCFERFNQNYFALSPQKTECENIKYNKNTNCSIDFITGIYKPDYIPIFLETDYSDSNIYCYTLSLYNPKSKEFLEPVNFDLVDATISGSTFSVDGQGNYWNINNNYGSKEIKNKIIKIDTKQNDVKIINVELTGGNYFYVSGGDSNYLYIENIIINTEKTSYQILVFDINSEEILKTINLDLIDNEDYKKIIPIDGQIYILTSLSNPDENDVTKFYKLNLTEEKLDFENEVSSADFTPGEIFVRQNKLYSLCVEDEAIIYCYDFDQNKAERLLTINPEDLWK